MHSWLRITLLTICTAVGIAFALAVALRKPTRLDGAASITSAPPVRASTVDSAPDPPVAAAMPAPVIAPYRDIVARQVGALEESIQQLEESSYRRERTMLRAIAAIQNRTGDASQKPPAVV